MKRKYIYLYLFFLLILILIYFPALSRWTINGDEAISLANIKNYPLKNILLNFFAMGGVHYQPLAKLTDIFFRSFLPSFQLIHFVNLGIFAFIPLFFSINISLFLPHILSLLLAIAFSISPFLYYHIFTISGIANSLILLSLLLLILILIRSYKTKSVSDRRYRFALLILIVSIFIKETFLINFFLFLIISLVKYKFKIVKTAFTVWPVAVLIALYFILRFGTLGQNDPNYTYIVNWPKLKENLLLIIPWLVNYPRGWQYGVPLAKPFFYLPLVFVNLSVYFLLYVYMILRKPKVFAVIIAGIVISLLPYLFLSRILVHHIDITYLLVFSGLLYSASLLKPFSRRLSIIIVFFIIIDQALTLSITLPQWTRYSFVGVSNETAQNFINTVKSAKIKNYNRVCIISHIDGAWPTANGRLINLLTDKNLEIISTENSIVPDACQNSQSLIFKNDSRKYYDYRN